VVLLVHALAVGRRADELVDAEADLLVRPRPVGAQATVPRRPRPGVVGRLEQPDALDDRPEAGRVVVVEHQRRDAEVPGRLVLRIVPELAPGLALERREDRPRLAAVAALEDPGRLDSDEHAAVASCE